MYLVHTSAMLPKNWEKIIIVLSSPRIMWIFLKSLYSIMRVFFSSYNGNFLELDDLFSVSAIIVRKLASKADFQIYFRAPALKKTLAPYFPCNTKTST